MADQDPELRVGIRIHADTRGASQAADGLRRVRGAAAEAAPEVKKLTASKYELRMALRALAREFPFFSQIARLALNPITAAIAGVVSALRLYKTRAEDTAKALSQFDLPDISKLNPETLGGAASAWAAIAENIHKAIAAWHSVPEAAERAQKQLERQLHLEKQLLAARRGAELAGLEARRGGLSAGEYAAARIAIEERYAQAGLTMEELAGKRKLAQLYMRQYNLAAAARQKEQEARQIRIAGPEFDKAVAEDLLKQRERWVEEQQKLAEQNERLSAGMSRRWRDVFLPWRWPRAWGTSFTEIRALAAHRGMGDALASLVSGKIETQGVASAIEENRRRADLAGAQVRAIDERLRVMREERAPLQKQRSELASEAGRLGAMAWQVGAEIHTAEADYTAVMEVARASARTELLEFLARQVSGMRTTQEQLAQQAQQQLQATGEVSNMTVTLLRQNEHLLKQLQERLKSLETYYR